MRQAHQNVTEEGSERFRIWYKLVRMTGVIGSAWCGMWGLDLASPLKNRAV